jgi:hypothetical protein
MGVYLNVYRLSPEWAVEALSGRQDMGDLKEGDPDSPIYVFRSSGNSEHLDGRLTHPLDQVDVRNRPEAICPDRNQLHVGRRYQAVADMLTGRFHSHENADCPFEVSTSETDDPLDWAVYGRRICGWREDFPLRYSTPSDLQAITDALADLTTESVRENLHHVAQTYPYNYPRCMDGYKHGAAEDFLDDFLPYLLPNLREFFGRAQAAGEFVVHHIG